MSENYYGRPLEVAVKDGQLIIAIGVNTLAHAVSYANWAVPYDENRNDYFRTFAITDPEQFAKDVMHAMLDEEEDGSSLLTNFIDKASESAVDDGSEGLCEDRHRIRTGKFARCEKWAATPVLKDEGTGRS